eukprot:132339-Hanusia_phi.AAC.1
MIPISGLVLVIVMIQFSTDSESVTHGWTATRAGLGPARYGNGGPGVTVHNLQRGSPAGSPSALESDPRQAVRRRRVPLGPGCQEPPGGPSLSHRPSTVGVP